MTGAKSLSNWNGMFGRKGRRGGDRHGHRIDGGAIGLLLRTSEPAMVITAPGRFSTITFQPSPSVSWAAITRLMMSGGVLGAVGTTMRMTFEGNGSAMACETMPRLPMARRSILARVSWEALDEYSIGVFLEERGVLWCCVAFIVSPRQPDGQQKRSAFRPAECYFPQAERTSAARGAEPMGRSTTIRSLERD